MKVYKMEPIDLLVKSHGFHPEKIQKIVTGTRYTAVLLQEGNIGVCANLGTKVDPNLKMYHALHIADLSHRIVLNAYFNAVLNYSNLSTDGGDIFDVIDFQNYQNSAMIGFFKPVVEKFQKKGIPLHIFDPRYQEDIITTEEDKEDFLQKADVVILTATSIFNLTFLKILSSTSKYCDIFLLGPSAPMTEEIFQYGNIKAIFGSTFAKNDERVLQIIADNGGTRQFLKYGKKRTLFRRNDI